MVNRLLAIGLTLFAASSASARADDTDDLGATLAARARDAEADGKPAIALELYRRALDLAPAGDSHARARRRIAFIEARSEGGYAPLAEWMRVQAIPSRQLTIAALRKFERRVQLFPPGLVRRESRAFLASAWLERFHRPHEALRTHEAWLIEPGIGVEEQRRAAWGAARARVAMGHARTALARWQELDIDDPDRRAWLRAAALAELGRPIAWTVLGFFVVVAFGLAGTSAFRVAVVAKAFSMRRCAVAAWVLAVPVGIAWFRDPAMCERVAWAAAAACGPLSLCSWSGVAQSERGFVWHRRALLAASGVLATFGGGFLVTDGFGVLSWWVR